jgi:hypothetical protein
VIDRFISRSPTISRLERRFTSSSLATKAFSAPLEADLVMKNIGRTVGFVLGSFDKGVVLSLHEQATELCLLEKTTAEIVILHQNA